MRWFISVLLNETRSGVTPKMIWTQLKRNPVPPGLGMISQAERRSLLGTIIEQLKSHGRFRTDETLDTTWTALERQVYDRYDLTPPGERD
jgi:hypothetical protein